jgi:hypothetical protein
LILFHRLLSTLWISEENSSKLLRWIFDLVNLSAYSLCLELSNIIESAKKKLLKLGFLILGSYPRISCEGMRHSEENFNRLVASLIEEKEREVSELQYEICRVC